VAKLGRRKQRKKSAGQVGIHNPEACHNLVSRIELRKPASGKPAAEQVEVASKNCKR
jgi:hypothetical protein